MAPLTKRNSPQSLHASWQQAAVAWMTFGWPRDLTSIANRGTCTSNQLSAARANFAQSLAPSVRGGLDQGVQGNSTGRNGVRCREWRGGFNGACAVDQGGVAPWTLEHVSCHRES